VPKATVSAETVQLAWMFAVTGNVVFCGDPPNAASRGLVAIAKAPAVTAAKTKRFFFIALPPLKKIMALAISRGHARYG
jgi:hypothetical protein